MGYLLKALLILVILAQSVRSDLPVCKLREHLEHTKPVYEPQENERDPVFIPNTSEHAPSASASASSASELNPGDYENLKRWALDRGGRLVYPVTVRLACATPWAYQRDDLGSALRMLGVNVKEIRSHPYFEARCSLKNAYTTENGRRHRFMTPEGHGTEFFWIVTPGLELLSVTCTITLNHGRNENFRRKRDFHLHVWLRSVTGAYKAYENLSGRINQFSLSAEAVRRVLRSPSLDTAYAQEQNTQKVLVVKSDPLYTLPPSTSKATFRVLTSTPAHFTMQLQYPVVTKTLLAVIRLDLVKTGKYGIIHMCVTAQFQNSDGVKKTQTACVMVYTTVPNFIVDHGNELILEVPLCFRNEITLYDAQLELRDTGESIFFYTVRGLLTSNNYPNFNVHFPPKQEEEDDDDFDPVGALFSGISSYQKFKRGY